MVAVGRLDNHGQPELLSGFPGSGSAGHHLTLGHRHAAGTQQCLGQILVGCNAFSDRAGVLGLGRPDAPLARTVAQLHQIADVQTDVWDATFGRRCDDAGRAGAKVAVIYFFADLLDSSAQIEGDIVDHGHHQPMTRSQRRAGHMLVAGAEHHAIDAAPGCASGLTEASGHARQVQQFDDHMLQHVAGPGARLKPFKEATTLADTTVMLDQSRQQRDQPLVEAGQQMAGMVFQFPQVEPGFQRRAVGPDVRAAQVVDAQQAYVFECLHVLGTVFSRRATRRESRALFDGDGFSSVGDATFTCSIPIQFKSMLLRCPTP